MAERLNLRHVVGGEHGEIIAQLGEMLDDLDLAVLGDERRVDARDLAEHLRGLIDDVRVNVQRVSQRIDNRIINTEEDRQRNQHRQAAARHADALLLVELLRLLVELHLVVGVDFLELAHLLLHLRLRRHGLLLLDGEREDQNLDDDGEQNDRDAVIAHDLVQEPEQVAEKASEPIKNIKHRRKTPLSW